VARKDFSRARAAASSTAKSFFTLGVVGDAAVGKAGERGKFRHEFAAGADDAVAKLDELGGETFKRGLIRDAGLEEGIAGADAVHVALEQREVAGLGLREQQVKEAAARAGGTLDELQIFGAKDDGAQGAKIIRQFFDGLAVESELPFAGGPVDLDLAVALPHHVAANKVAFRAVTDHLRAADAAEGTQRGHEIDGLQDVGLALCIVAEQQMEAGRKIGVQPRVVAEVTESQMGQMHGEKMERGRLVREFFVSGGICRRSAPLLALDLVQAGLNAGF
jgi:hypothetical protein